MGCGHVAPSCARRCAGSRLPDHARCSFFCAIATPCPRAPTPCNPFVCRSTMICTPAQPHLLVAAHTFCRVEITKKVMDAADINGTFFVQRATGELISHYRDRGCGLPRSRSSSVLLCQYCSQHVATAMPCPPCLSPPRCFRLCRGCTPRLRFLRDAAKSQRSPAPLGRPRLRCMCVCVWGDVMFLCRSMCFVLSGWLSFAMRLLQRSIITAVALLALPVSVSDARVVCCSPSRPSSVLGDVIFLCRLLCFFLSGRLPFAMRWLPRSVVLAAVLLLLSVSVSGARVICCSPSRLTML